MSYKHNYFKQEIKIGKKKISLHSPTFIIAEAACNHMCDLSVAKRMIREAKRAGVDAIKFQTYKAERLVCKTSRVYWRYPEKVESQFKYYKKLDRFGRKEYEQLFNYAKEKDIIAFSTPFDLESAALLNDLGVPVFKVASCDILDVRLLRQIARFNKPIILSTGASTLPEIKKAIKTIQDAGNPNLVLLVCTLSYPADNRDAHLKRILTFKEKFPNIMIGLSDHTRPDENMMVPSIAVALGAKVIEKHYTLDRTMSGSGHSFSVEPKDLKKMVANIRITEAALGERQIKVYDSEKATRINARRSLVAARDIRKGERISNEVIAVKRPCKGINPDNIDKIVGRIAKRAIKLDRHITWDMLG